VRTTWSFSARRELSVKIVPWYREESRKQKTVILNEFLASTGYKRKYAIQLFSYPEIPTANTIRRPRCCFYDRTVQEALEVARCAANCITSERPGPFLKKLVPVLENHEYVTFNDEARGQLISISPTTINRILQPRRSQACRAITLTRRGPLIKQQIRVRTFADWGEKIPGFFEGALVCHYGWNLEGSFLFTLVLRDVALAWVECLPFLHRNQLAVLPPPMKP